MLKKFLILIILFLSFFLVSCWKKKNKEVFDVKFWNYVLQLDKDFYLVNIKNTYKDINIIYAYKWKPSNKHNNFAPSLLIWEYTKYYSKNSDKFFTTMIDKLNKFIVWTTIIDKWEFKVWKNKAYYIKYKVDDNIFWEKWQNIYYWLQVYIIDNMDKKIYIISYVTLEKDKIDNIFNNIKNLKVND